MTTPADQVSRFERAKLLHDYFKHLTTVSTAAVVFMVTFHKEFPSTGKDGGLVAASIAATAYIWYASSEPRRAGKLVYLIGRTGSWVAFVAALVLLATFALTRLIR
jgi:hypothetical protein